jgi:hypothetical protein
VKDERHVSNLSLSLLQKESFENAAALVSIWEKGNDRVASSESEEGDYKGKTLARREAINPKLALSVSVQSVS